MLVAHCASSPGVAVHAESFLVFTVTSTGSLLPQCVHLVQPSYSNVLQVGPHICLFKTHVDIFDHWDASVADQLRQLADKHGKLTSACGTWTGM